MILMILKAVSLNRGICRFHARAVLLVAGTSLWIGNAAYTAIGRSETLIKSGMQKKCGILLQVGLKLA